MKISIKETAVFGILIALMYSSKVILDALPNIHLIGVLIVAATVVFRKKALFAIYGFVLLTGLLSGFATWWIPYLYIWTVLWGMVMLIPKKTPKKLLPIVYMAVCSLHGFLYGILYAPSQALIFGLDFNGMLAWILAGLPFDIIHGISNFICGLLIFPIIKILKRGIN